MAPEALHGASVQRSDIFSLGVTLYAALAGERKVERIDLPGLLQRRPEVTPELAAILERATAPQPSDRFGAAGELEQALSVHLARNFPSSTRAALAELVRAHATLQADPGLVTSARTEGTGLVSLTQANSPRALAARDALAPGRTLPLDRGSGSPLARVARWSIVPFVLGASLLAWRWQWVRPQVPVPPTLARLPTPSASPSVPPPAPPGPLSSGAGAPMAQAGSSRRHPHPAQRTADPARSLSRTLAPETTVPPPAMGWLSVNALPWGAVFLDEHQVAEDTPLYRLPVLAGKHRVTIRNPNRERPSPVQEVTVGAGETRTLSVRW
jgi:serine/threonine protein kinase